MHTTLYLMFKIFALYLRYVLHFIYNTFSIHRQVQYQYIYIPLYIGIFSVTRRSKSNVSDSGDG